MLSKQYATKYIIANLILQQALITGSISSFQILFYKGFSIVYVIVLRYLIFFYFYVLYLAYNKYVCINNVGSKQYVTCKPSVKTKLLKGKSLNKKCKKELPM